MAKQKTFLNSVKWAYTGNIGDKAASALFSLILAAFLGPREFGVVSIAVIYVGFLQMFLDQGLAAALIQRKDLDDEHLNAVFWMDVALSLFLIGVSFLLSGWWAASNHAPQAAIIIPVMSVTILFEALSVVQTSLLRRNMDFRSLSVRTNASVALGGAVGVALAYKGFGVWSIVAQQIFRDLFALVLLWRLSSWRPRFRFSWKHLRDLMAFSIPNFVAQLGIFADGQAGSVVLGLLFGPVAVGLYRVADRVMNSVITISTASIQAVSLPEFARLQDSPSELRKSVVTCIRLSSAVTIPALAGLAAVSRPLMATIGPKWIPGSDALKVLSVLGMATTLAFFTGPLMQALGKIRQLATLEWARTIVSVATIVIAGLVVRHGSDSKQVMGIALGRFASSVCIAVPVFIYLLLKMSRLSFRDFSAAVVPSAIAGCGVVGSIMLLNLSPWLGSMKPLVILFADISVGGIVGLGALMGLDAQLRSFASSLLRRVLRMQTANDDPTGRFQPPSLRSVNTFANLNTGVKVSVVIPTYNRVKILRDALESALAQTYRDFEIIVVDDGSSDNTREMVEGLRSDKIRYLCHEHNRGCSAAYNTAIAQASGELVAILDSDDLWRPEYLEQQVKFLALHPEIDLVFCDTEVRGGAETDLASLISVMPAFSELARSKQDPAAFSISSREMYLCLLEEVPIKPTAAVIRKELFNKVGGFDEAWPSGTDWDLFLRMSRVAKFGYINQILVTQRRTPDATHQKYREQDKLFLLEIFLKEKATLVRDSEALEHINRGICGLYNSLAWTYLDAGRSKKALSTYSRGFMETYRLMLLSKVASGVYRVARESVTGVPHVTG